MSTLEKLRQKQQARQAAGTDIEAALSAGGTATLAASLPQQSQSSSTDGRSLGAEDEDASGAASAAASSQPSRKRRLEATESVACPKTQEELRTAVIRFLCSDSPALGTLPVSGVGVNAALRREHMKAGHGAKDLAIFKADDTVKVLRQIRQDLVQRGASRAIVLDDEGPQDVLLVDIDRKALSEALSTDVDDNVSSGASARRSSGPSGQNGDVFMYGADGIGGSQPSCGAAIPHRGAAAEGVEASSMSSVEALLKAPTAKQKILIDAGDELRQLLAEPTAKQSLICQKFMNKSQSAAEFCPYGSRADCRGAHGLTMACSKIHFKKVFKPWTDESLGDCPYLDTCRHIDRCKYVHYALDLTVDQAKYLSEAGVQNRGTDTKRINELAMEGKKLPGQWIQCDLRVFPLQIFKGMITVVMADPPWDIHMELPYGTLTDDEVRNLRIGDIHEDGMLFLWVTGRAMELARECFRLWGYKRIEEIVWVKTNQLQRIIRTGRTGHWINHSKEHCLVGIKGNPKLNRNLDCDVIVSEVRETSRKPDEIYNLIERMFPNCLKLELFGRPHNVHENWIICGNQLDGVRICNDEIVRRYNKLFPHAKTDLWRQDKEAIALMPSTPSAKPPSGTGADMGWVTPMSAPPPGPPGLWTSPNGQPPVWDHRAPPAHWGCPCPYG
mmetsp:Transcript_10457/g.18858  ORF Transcript_10457/g.18858 Transcript_10457/m.18858 type:complete len:670 (-) Transcript_10457:29-2038(-)